MRKFLIRWWFTSNWEQNRSMDAVIDWNTPHPDLTSAELLEFLGNRIAAAFIPPQEYVPVLESLPRMMYNPAGFLETPRTVSVTVNVER